MRDPEALFVWRYLKQIINLNSEIISEDDGIDSQAEFAARFGYFEIDSPDAKRCKYCNSILQEGYLMHSSFKCFDCKICGWGKVYTESDEGSFLQFMDFHNEQSVHYSKQLRADNVINKHLSTQTHNTLYHSEIENYAHIKEQMLIEKILRSFPLNSAELSFNELGKYLHANSEKLLNVSPRRMELLVGDIYKNQGFQVEVTKSTRDHGKDLILLKRDEEPIIVEVKRYKNKIGVDVVRRLRGVQLTYGHRSAILVGTNYYTKDAIKEVNLLNAKSEGYDLEVKDIEDLLSMLNIYKSTDSLAQKIKKLNPRK